jgi:hypothetical protein
MGELFPVRLFIRFDLIRHAGAGRIIDLQGADAVVACIEVNSDG